MEQLKSIPFEIWLNRYWRICHPEHGGTLYRSKNSHGRKYTLDELQELHRTDPNCPVVQVTEKSIPECKHKNTGSAGGIITCLDCGFELVGW